MQHERTSKRDGLTFRVGGSDDAATCAGILALLRDIFELDLGLACDIWGWHPGYRAYSWMDGGTIAANVSTRPLPLVIGGRAVDALQIHCVATRPPYRRRGLFTDLMHRVLDDAEGRRECVLLYTGTPALYRPFGFRPLVEHRFRGRLARHGARRISPSSRILSLAVPEDLALILDLFVRRQPVSRHLGLVGNEDIFLANALMHPRWQLSYLSDEHALIVWDQPDGATRLLDIVASRIPPGASLAAALGLNAAADGSLPEIQVLFPPDRLDGSFEPVPHVPEDNDILCVRGPLAIESAPFMLPLTAVS